MATIIATRILLTTFFPSAAVSIAVSVTDFLITVIASVGIGHDGIDHVQNVARIASLKHGRGNDDREQAQTFSEFHERVLEHGRFPQIKVIIENPNRTLQWDDSIQMTSS